MTAGQGGEAKKRETDTQTGTERPSKFKPRSTLWDQHGRVGHSTLEIKRDRDTEGTETDTGRVEIKRQERDPETGVQDGRSRGEEEGGGRGACAWVRHTTVSQTLTYTHGHPEGWKSPHIVFRTTTLARLSGWSAFIELKIAFTHH